MRTLYTGKTKNVVELDNGQTALYFKDDMTGKDGVFDPGENQVGLTIEGAGQKGLALTEYFFQQIKAAEIPTHFLEADVANRLMVVKPADVFGQGLEVICRFRAVGSFLKRYEDYAAEGQELPGFVEITLKDDTKGDPVISKEALDILGILSADEYERVRELTIQVAQLIQADLAEIGLDLYDIKFEFGRDPETGEILLIDEISGGNMRVYEASQVLDPFELAERVLATRKS